MDDLELLQELRAKAAEAGALRTLRPGRVPTRPHAPAALPRHQPCLAQPLPASTARPHTPPRPAHAAPQARPRRRPTWRSRPGCLARTAAAWPPASTSPTLCHSLASSWASRRCTTRHSSACWQVGGGSPAAACAFEASVAVWVGVSVCQHSTCRAWGPYTQSHTDAPQCPPARPADAAAHGGGEEQGAATLHALYQRLLEVRRLLC